jgi:hypothetical protein
LALGAKVSVRAEHEQDGDEQTRKQLSAQQTVIISILTTGLKKEMEMSKQESNCHHNHDHRTVSISINKRTSSTRAAGSTRATPFTRHR